MMTASTAGELRDTELQPRSFCLIAMRLLRYLVRCGRGPLVPAQPLGVRVPQRVWRRNAALLVSVYARDGR